MRIEVVEEGTYPLTAIPFAHDKYTIPYKLVAGALNAFPIVLLTSASVAEVS